MSIKVQSSLQLLQSDVTGPFNVCKHASLQLCTSCDQYESIVKGTQGLFKLRLGVAAVHSHFTGCSLYRTLVLPQCNVQIL